MKIRHIISPREKDLGGFSVRRVLPYAKQRTVGPWIFFDHMGPAKFPAGNGINVRPHPHINLATVTYLFEGEIFHRDSLGSNLAIHPGDINLMVAGRGITHSERERDEVHSVEHQLHGLQLWLALPEKDEECEPEFHHYPSAKIPAAYVDGISVRVMIGTAYGVTSPVRTFSETLYVEAEMKAGENLHLPKALEGALYLVSGRIKVGDLALSQYQMLTADDLDSEVVTAIENSRIAIIGGEPIGERQIYWNFVSSKKERIEKAKLDWKEKRFPSVPGDEIEFTPLPD